MRSDDPDLIPDPDLRSDDPDLVPDPDLRSDDPDLVPDPDLRSDDPDLVPDPDLRSDDPDLVPDPDLRSDDLGFLSCISSFLFKNWYARDSSPSRKYLPFLEDRNLFMMSEVDGIGFGLSQLVFF